MIQEHWLEVSAQQAQALAIAKWTEFTLFALVEEILISKKSIS